jgi:hypothetical protein
MSGLIFLPTSSDSDVADELDRPGLLVDLDHRDVRAERPRAVRRVPVGRLVEVRLHALGRVEREIERERDLLERLDLVRAALDEVVRAVDLDVVGDASRRCAAYCLAFSRILPAALIAAVMPTDDVREPYDP